MSKRREKPFLTYVIDTREQRPFDLALPDKRYFRDGGIYTDGLEAGDLTVDLDGVRLPIIIERKQHGDYVNCVARDRERFERELARLAAYDRAHIIIEAPMSLIKAGFGRSLVSGDAALNSAACWDSRFGVRFWFCTNHIQAGVWAWTLLCEYAKHHIGGAI